MQPLAADDLPCALVTLDGDGRVIDMNAVFLEWTGETAEQLLGRRLDELLVRGDGPGPAGAVFENLVHADGSQRAVLPARAHAPAGEVVTLVDASERAAHLALLARTRSLEERTRNRLELVIEASIAFATATTENELAEILATTVARAYQAEESAVFLVGDDGRFSTTAGTNPLTGVIDQSVMSPVIDGRQIMLISGAEQGDEVSPILGAAMRERGVHALLAAPIRHEDILFGVFGCFFLHPRQFDWEAAPLADALSGQAGQAATTLRLQRQLEHAATHDETTGLPNRRLLEAQLLVAASKAAAASAPAPSAPALIATLFIDLDGFKSVNDSLGHHVGDLLLHEVGKRLTDTVRQGDFVARYGGDEFVVVCDVNEPSDALEVAERIRQAIEVPFDDLPEVASVRASIGMSIAQAHGWDPEDLIRAADHAMYSAKNAGGNRIVDVLVTRTDEMDASISASA